MPVWPHVIEILNFHFPATFKQLVPLPEEGMACYYLTKIFCYNGLHIFFSFELPDTCAIPVIGNGGQKICTYSTEKNALLNVVPWLTWIQRSLRTITTLFCGSHWNAFYKSGMTLVSSWLPYGGSPQCLWCMMFAKPDHSSQWGLPSLLLLWPSPFNAKGGCMTHLPALSCWSDHF